MISTSMSAALRPTAAHLWKTFRSKPNAIPVDEQNCSPSYRNRVHLPTGMLFGITTNGVQLQTGIVFTFDRIPHKVQTVEQLKLDFNREYVFSGAAVRIKATPMSITITAIAPATSA
jgi:hypothetical protein